MVRMLPLSSTTSPLAPLNLANQRFRLTNFGPVTPESAFSALWTRYCQCDYWDDRFRGRGVDLSDDTHRCSLATQLQTRGLEPDLRLDLMGKTTVIAIRRMGFGLPGEVTRNLTANMPAV